MFLLLTFISIVAVFCVTVTLIVITVHKTNELGLLKAVGFPVRDILMVLLWHSWIQCAVGTLAGIGAGLLTLHYRNDAVVILSRTLGIEVFPKSIYQLSQIPASDKRSHAILEQMKTDEAKHATTALDHGGKSLPFPVTKLMQAMSKVMTRSAYWI